MSGGSSRSQSTGVVATPQSEHASIRGRAVTLWGGLVKSCAGPRGLLIAGLALLCGWTICLGISLCQEPLPRAVPIQKDYFADRKTYILLEPFVGMDFHHNYGAVKLWRQGGDPYSRLAGDPANETYVYPPLTLVAFAWADLFPPGPQMVMTGMNGRTTEFRTSKAAIVLWTFCIAAILSAAAVLSWKNRGELGLGPWPFPFVLATALCSYPALFELERGNCNVLVLLALIAMAMLLRRPATGKRDSLIGLCVAAAIGIKPYAVVLLPGLLVLWRFRAALYGIAWLALQAIWLSPDLNRWMAIAKVQNQTSTNTYMDWSHSLVAHWQLIWRDLHVSAIGAWPAQFCVVSLLIAVCAIVGWPLFRRRGATSLAWPFLLWLTGVGTMLLPLAYDYNLFFVPLAVVALWRRQDPWWVHAIVALVALWTQPFYIGIVSLPWLLIKACSVLLVGSLVARRIRDERPSQLSA